VIVLLDKQETIVLNEVGSRIWETMDGKKNIAEITRTLASEFDIAYEESLKDTAEFIEDLVKREAAVINPPTSPA